MEWNGIGVSNYLQKPQNTNQHLFMYIILISLLFYSWTFVFVVLQI